MEKNIDLLTGDGIEDTTPKGVFTDVEGNQVWFEKANEVHPGVLLEIEERRLKREQLEKLMFEIKLLLLKLKYAKKFDLIWRLMVDLTAIRIKYAVIQSIPVFPSGSIGRKENPLAIVGERTEPEIIQKRDGTKVKLRKRKLK